MYFRAHVAPWLGSKFLCGGDGETEEMACHILAWPMVIFRIARPEAAHIKVQMRRRRPHELFVQMTNHHVLARLLSSAKGMKKHSAMQWIRNMPPS